mgnify:CR=1 FL=1
MKRHGILNSEISHVLSYMGHTDQICIGDCGLPIPEQTKRIDLALTFGQPSFMDVLKEVAKDMKIEKIYLAEEIKWKNPKLQEEIQCFFDAYETGFKTSGIETNIEVEYISHKELKNMTRNCKAVIRTGETTPYANIILQSDCIF